MPSTSDRTHPFQLLIVGGGPGGMATLLAAHHTGQLDDLLKEGVAIVEKGSAIGAGTLGQYAINSDSSGLTFVDCLRSSSPGGLTELYNHPLTRTLAEAGDGAVALKDAAEFLNLVGARLKDIVATHKGCNVFLGHTAISARRTLNGWSVTLRDSSGQERIVYAKNVVLSTGAGQPLTRLAAETVGNASLTALCGDRLLQSDDVLSHDGLRSLTQRLKGLTSPRVAVIGGSTSAVAVCHALLNRMPEIRFSPDGVTLLHRRELRVYYPDAASALAENYTEFGPDDICNISGKVFRFAGFRLESRELVMQARGLGNRPPEPRLRLHHLATETETATRECFASADIVISALGYRPRALPVYDLSGAEIPLKAGTGPQEPLVDSQCRVLRSDGVALPGLFGMGLAAGFVPRGPLGGEASFRGQANGLWLWQKDVGSLIVNAIQNAPKYRDPSMKGSDSFTAAEKAESVADISALISPDSRKSERPDALHISL
ncbi:FAD-dependent oxidoreductase [Acetobacter oeni]|uniref:FAD/NAD(P)-binding domain-containing protein n=1 Tax=Acetobacter oeni TaxID=304077 RepID=A0A511XHC8_9PROT|nr:FAD-dependent oxidoreductase [Acetobacter oeni]MBB3882467.1 hypothetical protein [Acetobacter oeni]NHO18440.1 SidA/IucD/PvdA family monooxygenase [Acetobacter oeni]GBR03266.1 hypothetical protein AA21952_1003 [Acetobacter oeni LMG 21952]GEN62321.1 hypothetical protein AOE01nite_05450 [Acetobacter oeni]